MKTSPKGIGAIVLHEGVVTKAYRDVAGVLTIGVGHTSNAGPPVVTSGMVISRDRAMQILASDLASFEARVAKALPNVPQHVFDGSVSFDFNTGRIHNASWVKYLRAGNLGTAEGSLKTWNKAGGKVWSGLVNRRKAEADLIFRGIYPIGAAKAGAGGIPATNPAAPNDKATVAEYQSQLARLGYATGPVDGIRGPKTITAVKTFQRDHDLVQDGIVGPATRATLARAIAALSPPSPPPVVPPSSPEPVETAPSLWAWLVAWWRKWVG